MLYFKYMKRILLFFLLIGVTGFAGMSQKTARINPDKYRINFPPFWKPRPKAMRTLIDRLPGVCEELKDKDICGDDCRPKYTLEFYMSEPVIADFRANPIASGYQTRSYNIVTSYAFECALVLFDENDRLIKRVNLVNLDQTWTVTHRAELQNGTSTFQNRQVTGISNPVQPGVAIVYNLPGMYAPAGRPAQTPYSYIREHEAELYPTRADMLNVVENMMKEL